MSGVAAVQDSEGGNRVRRAANVDLVQAEIVSQLRSCGVSVQHLHGVGSGCPDLLVGWRGQNFLLELKTDKSKARKCQEAWHAKWAGQVAVARTFTEAMTVITKAQKEGAA